MSRCPADTYSLGAFMHLVYEILSTVFSSPEHLCSGEMLWAVSSIVHRALSVVRRSPQTLNNISSQTTEWILTKLHQNDPWVDLYQSCSNRSG